MTESEKIITVARLFDATEAEIVANGLRSLGIHCFIGNAHQGGITGSNVCQVELMVREEDLDRAVAYLKEHHDIDA